MPLENGLSRCTRWPTRCRPSKRAPSSPSVQCLMGAGSGGWSPAIARCHALPVVNGARKSPQKWRRKIPQLGGLAISRLFGASVFRWSAPAFPCGGMGSQWSASCGGLPRGRNRRVRAGDSSSLDLDGDGVAQEAIEERGSDDAIAEDLSHTRKSRGSRLGS